MSLYTHWACFECRKSFHYLPNAKGGLKEKRKCPECRKDMYEGVHPNYATSFSDGSHR